MSCVRMAEYMRVDMFFKLKAFQSSSQDPLNPTVTYMIFGILSVLTAITA